MVCYLPCNYEGIFRQNDGNCNIVNNFVSNHLITNFMVKRLQILHCQGSTISVPAKITGTLEKANSNFDPTLMKFEFAPSR